VVAVEAHGSVKGSAGRGSSFAAFGGGRRAVLNYGPAIGDGRNAFCVPASSDRSHVQLTNGDKRKRDRLALYVRPVESGPRVAFFHQEGKNVCVEKNGVHGRSN